MTPTCFTLSADAPPLVFAGAQDRYAKNVAALQLLRALQSDGRAPGELRPDELWTLAHYTAFGASALLQRALAPTSEVARLVSEAEQKLLKRTALTAFYTPPPVYHALWAALAPSLRQLDGPLSVLEPACGTGLAIATMPCDLRERAATTAVELDDVTGQIATFLHPDVRLTYGRGFETVDLPADTYDLVISNVPFGDLPIFDPALEQEGAFLTKTIHDYFVARALRLTRPGGVVALLTSYGTLDKRDARVRAWLAQRAELLGAYRLPQGVMEATGGTASGADILLLRRRQHPAHDTSSWTETAVVELPIVDAVSAHFTTGSRVDCDDPSAATGELRVARHFVDHPAHVIGTIGLMRHNGIVWEAVLPPDDVDVATVLAERLQHLPQPLVLPPHQPSRPPSIAPIPAIHRSSRVAGLLDIYDAAKAILRQDTVGADGVEERATLNRIYDQFVRGYGPIHARANQQALRGEPELLFLKALESNVRSTTVGIVVDKAPIFDHPTIRPTTTVTPGAMTPDEALVWCLNDRGQVSLEHIATLCGASTDAVAAALAGRIFPIPGTTLWQTADDYLSGNIAQKLHAAERAAASDDHYAANVAALQAVLPAPPSAAQINARLGAPWIPEPVVADFITFLIPAFRQAQGTVRYLPPLATWLVTTQWMLRGNAVEFAWGTPRVHAIDLLGAVLNQRPIAVYDEHDDDTRTLNKTATLAAREKAQRIRDAWKAWVWTDATRTQELCTIYNAQFVRC